MAVGLTCSAAWQRVSGCCIVGVRRPPSLKSGLLVLLILLSVAYPSVILVQSSAAADARTSSRTHTREPASHSTAGLSYEWNEFQPGGLSEDGGVQTSHQPGAPEEVTDTTHGRAPPSQKNFSRGEDPRPSHHVSMSAMNELPVKGSSRDTFSRGESNHAEQSGTQVLKPSYEPRPENISSRGDLLPRSNPWGGVEGGTQGTESQRPLNALGGFEKGWLHPEGHTVEGVNGSLMMKEHRASAEEGRIQGSGTSGGSVRLSQRSRSRATKRTGKVGSATPSRLRRTHKSVWQDWTRLAGVLAVLLGSALLYRRRPRRQANAKGREVTDDDWD